MMEILAKWWTDKYRLPSNHELFQSCTLFELLVEFWEDYYYKNPLEAHRNPDGQVQFKDTGDDLIDKWEAQIAQGKTPDLMESFTQEQVEQLERLRKKGKSRESGLQTMQDTAELVEKEAGSEGLKSPPASKESVPPIFGFGDGEE